MSDNHKDGDPKTAISKTDGHSPQDGKLGTMEEIEQHGKHADAVRMEKVYAAIRSMQDPSGFGRS